MTGYTAGLLNHRITIHPAPTYTDGPYGRQAVPGEPFQRWANVTWAKGDKAMREGTMDAYDTIMVRLRYDTKVTRDCKVEIDGTTYRIKTFRPDQRQGTIQITAVEEIAG